MERSDVGFACSAVGAGMLAAGATGYAADWVFLTAGAALALGGLVTLGTTGSVLLVLCGAWVAASVALPWAAARWNLLAAGILAISLGFTAGAVGAVRSRPSRAREEP